LTPPADVPAGKYVLQMTVKTPWATRAPERGSNWRFYRSKSLGKKKRKKQITAEDAEGR